VKVTGDDPRLGASILEALPHPTLLVDRELRVRYANGAARSILGARAGAGLGAALGCAEGAIGACGAGPRCAGCAFERVAHRALAGERCRGRAFLLRTGEGGAPADLHLLVSAAPLERGAVLVLQDVDAILADPDVVSVCGACGRIEDEEGEWHPLHRYLEDRLGLEAGEALCPACARRAGRGGRSV